MKEYSPIPVGKYVGDFIQGVECTPVFPLSYWMETALTAYRHLPEIRGGEDRPVQCWGGGFPPTDYQMRQIYGEAIPGSDFSPHNEDSRFRKLPGPNQFDETGCYIGLLAGQVVLHI